MKLIVAESRMSVIHILGVRMLLFSLPLIRTVDMLMFTEIYHFSFAVLTQGKSADLHIFLGT